MPANQRPYARAIPLIYILAACAILAGVGTLGVRTLMVQQQLKQGGERLKNLRARIDEMANSNDYLKTQKKKLTAAPALEKAIKDGFIKLVPIEQRFVLSIPANRRVVASATVMPASEEGR